MGLVQNSASERAHSAHLATLEQILGGQVLGLQSVPGGASRELWVFELYRDGQRLPMAMFRITKLEPWYGTRFEMRREAQVLRALEGSGLPVARIHHISQDGEMMVMERLPGRSAFTFTDPAQRLRVIDDFSKQLHALHALDTAKLALPFEKVTTRRDGTLADIADYAHAYQSFTRKHRLIEEVMAWIIAHMPENDGAPSLVHGDAGPTNFLHDDEKVTGLIDWEMAHVGDPREDLAWIWFRAHMLKFDHDARPWFEAYQRHSGIMLDPARLRFYALLVIFRCNVATHKRQENAPVYDDARPAVLRQWLADAWADAKGGMPRKLPPIPFAD